MKKSVLKLLILVAVVSTFSATAGAQVFIKIRPMAPVIVRPLAPSPRHIWVEGDWVWRGGGYQYKNGYWAVPARRGAIWVPGHWKQKRRGWVWKPGRWR